MADWKKIGKQVGSVANKAARKTEEIADITVKRVKLSALESKLGKQYEKLGRLTYKQLKTGETQADKISAVIPEIDRLRDEVSAMRREIEEDKKRREESKKQAAAAKVNIEVIIPEAREETKADAENNAD